MGPEDEVLSVQKVCIISAIDKAFGAVARVRSEIEMMLPSIEESANAVVA